MTLDLISITLTNEAPPQQLSVEKASQQALHAMQRGLVDTAVDISKQIIKQRPTHEASYKLLYNAYYHEANFVELEFIAKRFIDTFPNHMHGYLALASSQRYQQKHGEAYETLTNAIKLFPDEATIYNQLGLIAKESGDIQKSLENFNYCLSLDDKVTEAYWNRADIFKTITDNDIQQMVALLESSKFNPQAASYVHYAIARAYEFKAEYDLSFVHLKKGAEQKRKCIKYNHQKEIEEYKRIPLSFTEEILHSQMCAQDNSVPIFICGMPRSGTTLIEQIVSSHINVTAGEELHDLAAATASILKENKVKEPYPLWASSLTQKNWHEIGFEYLSRTKKLQEKKYFTDKMPLNFKAIGLIHLALPKAKIIHCIRSPMDTIFGCYKQLFATGARFSYDLSELTDTYIEYRLLMDYWMEKLGDKIFEIKYEDIVENPEPSISKLLTFLELEWSDDCMNFHQNKRIVHTASNAQIRQPLFKHGIGRWKHYQKHLEEARVKIENI